MSVVERYSKTVETETLEEFCIVVGEEILQKLVEEELVFLLAQDLEQRGTMSGFMAREACYKVLHTVVYIVSYGSEKCAHEETTDFIQPPIAAPLNSTGVPLASTIFVSWTRRNPLDMVTPNFYRDLK
jgi:hypothetical protein